MTDRTVPYGDDELAAALRALGTEIDWPVAAAPGRPDAATRVRARIVATPAPSRRWWRPAGRGLALALLALLALAAVAGAVSLGLPGLRIFLGDPSTVVPRAPGSGPTGPTPAGGGASPGASSVGSTASPSRTPAPTPRATPSTSRSLGARVPVDDIAARAPRPIRLPTDPAIGAPDAAYIDRSRADQVALVWEPDASLPATHDPDIGMILMTFDGTISENEFFGKVIGSGSTIDPVEVDGDRGYWIEGDPHIFFYESPDGFVGDERRWVGDALVWSDGVTTYRIESALGRDATIAIAESLE